MGYHGKDELSGASISRRELLAAAAVPARSAEPRLRPAAGYVTILRPPDFVTAFSESETVPLSRQGYRWTAPGLQVRTEPRENGLPVQIDAPDLPCRASICAGKPGFRGPGAS
jgi:hypothetical protein